MDIALRRAVAATAACALSLLTTASMIASPSLAEDRTVAAPQADRFLWSKAAVSSLQLEVAASAAEGLDPLAYDSASLAQIVQIHGESAEVDAAATKVALSLAGDYSHGHVDQRSRPGWYIDRTAPADEALEAQLVQSLRANDLRSWLRGLLPSDRRYTDLRAALAATPESDTATRDKLRANLERWRWMPRTLGEDHIYVNVPSYSLKVVENGQAVSTYTVVVGKPSTPTPQMAAEAGSIVVNPWWNVPPSIAKSMRGKKGFQIKAGGRLAQPPGPRNALGKVKIDMPNAHNIYLHDTPSKSLFSARSRAYSHGCIRVKDIDRLASELAILDQGNDLSLRQALAKSGTRSLQLQKKRPVYLVYFTVDIGPDGRMISLEDPYDRDASLVSSLDATTKLANREQPRVHRS